MLSSTLRQTAKRSFATMAAGNGFIDLHSHIYLPRYVDEMKSRDVVPKVIVNQETKEERIVLLPGEDDDATTAIGRPFGEQYWSIDNKIKFMDIHNIDTSVISLANPWLDFIKDAQHAHSFAQELNDEMNDICAKSDNRLYGFGVLSIPGGTIENSVSEIHRIAKDLPHVRGVIIGTSGCGKGLDDPQMLPIYKALEDTNLCAFIHPHYGLGNDEMGHGYGHVLPLALGFPFETSAAVARLILSGMLDQVPNVKLLLSHSGGTLPFLAGRLDSCAETDETINLKHPPSHYLKRLYYDAICYDQAALEFVIKFASLDHIVFGTDHPFFPPKAGQEKWKSTTKVQDAITGIGSQEVTDAIARNNALKFLGLA